MRLLAEARLARRSWPPAWARRPVEHLHVNDPDDHTIRALGERLLWDRELVRQLQDLSLAPGFVSFGRRLLVRLDVPVFEKNRPFEWLRVDVVLEPRRVVTWSSKQTAIVEDARSRWEQREAGRDGGSLLAIVVSEIVEAVSATLARFRSHFDRLVGTRRTGEELDEGETLARLGEQLEELRSGIERLIDVLSRAEAARRLPRLRHSTRAELVASRDRLLLIRSEGDELASALAGLSEFVSGREGLLDVESPQIIEVAASVGEHRLHRLTPAHAMTGLVGGMAVSFGALAMAFAAGPFWHALGPERAHFLGALAFPIGFIILILGKGELFTENFFVPVTSVWMRRAKWSRLASLWGLTLLGNLVGAALFAYLGSRPGVLEDGAAAFLQHLAVQKVNVPLWIGAVKAVFAGWVITLMTWLILASRGWGARMAIIWMMGFLLVAGHFHHVVISATEIFIGIGLGAEITLWQWFTRNFLVSLAGNLVGGVVFVTLVGYLQAHALQTSQEHQSRARKPREGPRVHPRRPTRTLHA